MKRLEVKKSGDNLLIIAVIILAVLGAIFIYSASKYSALSTYNDQFYFVRKQILGIVIGSIVMVMSCLFDYEKLKKINLPFAIVTLVLLGLVFVPGVGVENYGAKRWIGVGSLTLQPSELAKFSLILFSASYISKNPEKCRTFMGVIPILIYGLILCAMIMLEPNMSITVCVATLMITMLFCAGLKMKYFFILIIPAVIFAVILILIEPYRLSRLSAFLDPWSNPKGEGYQLLQSLYALGAGGWFGVGLFNSRQKYAFLPFRLFS